MPQPIETFQRPLIKGPMQVNSDGSIDIQGAFTSTGVNSFSGTNNLGGTNNLNAPLVAAATNGGVTAIASGDTTVVVSTTAVKSNSAILLSMVTPPASHVDLITSTLSITEAGGFTVQVQNATVASQSVSYFIVNQQ